MSSFSVIRGYVLFLLFFEFSHEFLVRFVTYTENNKGLNDKVKIVSETIK
jgi:hypothetical protein